MDKEKHACKDCKNFSSNVEIYLGYYDCYVYNKSKIFHPIWGQIEVFKPFTALDQNKDGDCEYFKPSLLARFLRLFGRKY